MHLPCWAVVPAAKKKRIINVKLLSFRYDTPFLHPGPPFWSQLLERDVYNPTFMLRASEMFWWWDRMLFWTWKPFLTQPNTEWKLESFSNPAQKKRVVIARCKPRNSALLSWSKQCWETLVWTSVLCRRPRCRVGPWRWFNAIKLFICVVFLPCRKQLSPWKALELEY